MYMYAINVSKKQSISIHTNETKSKLSEPRTIQQTKNKLHKND